MSSFARQLLKPAAWPTFARGMLAYGSAEAVIRVFRLAAILVVARLVSPATLGVAALALSLFEIVRVLANVGIGQRIIAATDAELASICEAASRLFWGVCAAVAAIQLCVAMLVSSVVGQPDIAAMLAVLALVYLFMPAGLVQVFLTLRAQRMGATARIVAAQNVADSVLTVLLVFVWPSAWAIVLPKLLTAPLWLVMARRTCEWRSDATVAPAPASAFTTFGFAVLGSECLAAVRLHGDKLIVGALLGTKALGLYYFAFNAGLGITLSLVSACNLVLFPQLSRLSVDALDREFGRALLLGMAAVLVIVGMQVLLAPLYVPVVFGPNWTAAIPFLSVLACAAVPLFAGSVFGARFRAQGNPFAETRLMSAATLAALSGLAIGAGSGLVAASAGFTFGLAAVFAVPVSRFIFRDMPFRFNANRRTCP